MHSQFRRVAIVNRGEPAMRFIHAVREFNLEHRADLFVIALFTEPDRQARFVRESDESYGLGPSTFVDGRDGLRRPTYLDYAALERALTAVHAEAVWSGWGFVGERPEFAEMCERLGIVVIGPDSGAMRRLGDKINAKRFAEAAGIPVVPWGGGPADTVEAARAQAERLGYPVLFKASGGAGGRGIQRVDSAEQIDAAFGAVRRDAARTFNDTTLVVERYLPGMRHIEVQIQADAYGTVWAVGTRDCSIQRRLQKLASEAPAVGLLPGVEAALLDAAVRLVAATHYRNQVSVEFLVDSAGRYWFLEANTRLQVEHVVTELTSGLDLVKLELGVARGARLDPVPPVSTGHAIEVRLNAEDPYNGFAASPGVLSLFRLATGPGLRVDTSMAEGHSMPPEFGSMFGKLAARGSSRDEALGRLKRALADSAVVVSGGPTNRAFLLQVLERPEIQRGVVDAGWLDRMMVGEAALPERHAKIALLQAAVEVYEVEAADEVASFFASAARLRPSVRNEIGRPVELGYRGHRYELRVYRVGEGQYRVAAGATRLEVEVERDGPCDRWLTTDGRRYRVLAATQGYTLLIEVEGVPHAISRADEGVVRAASPAVVVSVQVAPGDEVMAGDRLVVLEAMKMEMGVTAPFSGVVRQVFILPNAQVGPGTPLVHLDPAADTRRRTTGPKVVFDAARSGGVRPSGRPASRARALLRGVKAGLEEITRPAPPPAANTLPALRSALLGFDLDAADIKGCLQDYERLVQGVRPDDPALVHAEEDLLRIFVDVRAVFGRQPAEDDDVEQALGSEQYLYTYLRTLDSQGTDLPASFLEQLKTGLGHFGVHSLEPGPSLREGLLGLFKANQRSDIQASVVRAVLQRRLSHAEHLAPGTQTFLGIVSRLVGVLQGRFPDLADLGRDVQYRYIEQPAFERVRGSVQDEMMGRLVQLALDPAPATADALRRDLVACAQPLRSMIAGELAAFAPPVRLTALEVLMRRDYRFRALDRVQRVPGDEPPLVLAAYPLDGQTVDVMSTCAPLADIDACLTVVGAAVAELPPEHDAVVDIYTWSSAPVENADALAASLSDRLEAAAFDRPLRRVIIVVVPPRSSGATLPLQFFTFRPFGPGYREEKLYRGMHPMLGKRLHIWRLKNFFLERLPSVEDVYLFRGVARENARDERFFVLAEIRDLTPYRDANGQVIAMPHLERMALEALTALRRAQLQRKSDDRLHWNRVMLIARPPMIVDRPVIEAVARRIAVQADGLGLERISIRAEMPDPEGVLHDTVVSIAMAAGRAPVLGFVAPPTEPLKTLSDYDQKVVRMRQRGLIYPYEIIRMMTAEHAGGESDIPPGSFVELDLDASGALAPVDRPYGKNGANIVVGLLTNRTLTCAEGMTRVVLLGDPSREVGSLAEPECRRILGALDLAEAMQVPLEWFALSAGAKISMDSGTENMDWISRVLRRIIEYTQAGGEVNIVVTGINVGAQPYWNAEATMLMHTRGILIMTPEGAMVLTGKTALDYSGSVSADDNIGIGGYEHIMGPNGQAQYWGRDLRDACRILMRHYDHCYVVPGERFPRRAPTTDPRMRDIRGFPHDSQPGGFATVGDVFSVEHNPDRKRPFDIRRVMLSVTDQDHAPLERWPGWRDAEVAVSWDAHIGGYPVCVVGFESRSVPRLGPVPADGPEQWTSGTLFPMSSKKIARTVSAASGNRPLVILANLSGFDGSPESMRGRQLEFGAEIGRAVVNFKGPIIFVVVSRYHGGAFVVFSKVLNENVEVAALEGSFASVIGGAPAAAVVFARDVDGRTRKDARVLAVEAELKAASDGERASIRARLVDVIRGVRSEKLGDVADEFDGIHSVHRALNVGSLDRIISAAQLRPYLIDAVERGMKREMERIRSCQPPSQ